MASAIRAIIGLGNPGAEYADTRHNAGFRFLALAAAEYGAVLRAEPRFSAAAAKATIDAREVWLLAPQTFMNNSGDAAVKFAHFYKLAPAELLVVHDELDLPLGAVRLKVGGGAGGHNGVADIAQKLGTPDFARLRIGIGRPEKSAQVVSYVLKRPPLAEAERIDAALLAARRELPTIVRGDFARAMNALHRCDEATDAPPRVS